uniref:Uncharacterized protein n=1 Tax=Utricularia reniformis TaxID=192314 RepID=A0A1Y0B301_9LAMI|nr:hypothetical protein AEK19_MT1632 [Utricularia reniformis]ART31816.1 hypothetical protein AEK19_MT1632 [Utricularia reniformis]
MTVTTYVGRGHTIHQIQPLQQALKENNKTPLFRPLHKARVHIHIHICRTSKQITTTTTV